MSLSLSIYCCRYSTE